MSTLDEVSDSTDWLSTPLAGLSRVEASLRCQVCKDFYTTPMITSCSHTFCSICIRRYLSQEGRCPACREPDQELKLRRNWTVEELVTQFVGMRGDILTFARQSQQQQTLSGRPSKRRRIEVEPDRERRSTRSQTKQSSQTLAQEVADSEDDGSVYDDRFSSAPEKVNDDDGLVGCPSCNRRMKESAINGHLDRCLSGLASPEPPKTQANSFSLVPRTKSPASVAPTRLPSINYALFKEGALRKKVKELGLPDHGTKEALKKRHTEWMNLWNANCDSARPRPKRELLRELDSWERTQNRQNVQGSGIMAKEFDRDGWAKEHNGDFDNLIQQAREKAKIAKQEREKAAKEEKERHGTDTGAMNGIGTSTEATMQPHANSEASTNGQTIENGTSTPRKLVSSSVDLTTSPLTPEIAGLKSPEEHPSTRNGPPVLSHHFS